MKILRRLFRFLLLINHETFPSSSFSFMRICCFSFVSRDSKLEYLWGLEIVSKGKASNLKTVPLALSNCSIFLYFLSFIDQKINRLIKKITRLLDNENDSLLLNLMETKLFFKKEKNKSEC